MLELEMVLVVYWIVPAQNADKMQIVYGMIPVFYKEHLFMYCGFFEQRTHISAILALSYCIWLQKIYLLGVISFTHARARARAHTHTHTHTQFNPFVPANGVADL